MTSDMFTALTILEKTYKRYKIHYDVLSFEPHSFQYSLLLYESLGPSEVSWVAVIIGYK